MVKDPVCGALVDPDAAEWTATYLGETFYFCCLHCMERFTEDPVPYVRRAVPDPVLTGAV